MLYDPRDTIVAVASAPGGAARGIVRLSGPDVPRLVARTFVQPETEAMASARRPLVWPASLRLSRLERELPGLLYFWPTSRSYTRQPTAELHTIGSPPLLAVAVEEFCRSGARPAAAGEFTLRAFLAGRIDLTQAEAVLGVIDAQGERQLQAALAQLAGGLATPLGALRNALLDLLARLEASLDFASEDIELISDEEIAAALNAAASDLGRIARQIGSRGESADLVRVVLVGRPNAGKSSLFNALAGATAIVSDVPGTTRDYLTARLDLGGVACELVDTAGVQADGDAISPHAQRQMQIQSERAQITLLCIDGGSANVDPPLPAPAAGDQIVVLTKHDLKKVPGTFFAGDAEKVSDTFSVSAWSGYGLDELRGRIAALAEAAAGSEAVAATSTAARATHSVQTAADALERALRLCDERAGEELLAAETRLALDELGKVSGAVTTDDVLDRIFSRFCIGK